MHISQPPGEGNALGRIRFNFPNRFLVYQHDTPDKHMFAHDVRAYSHGCMRVQDPAKYAEVLFNIARPSEHWTAERVKSMFGTGEQDIQLQPTPIWVHLTYQTAFVDDAGKLQIRRDVYNLDSRTLAAIKSERGVIEPPQERKREEEVAATSNAGPLHSRAPFHSSSRCSASAARRKEGPCRRAASRADRARCGAPVCDARRSSSRAAGKPPRAKVELRRQVFAIVACHASCIGGDGCALTSR